tara:strand:+ start:982 stop:1833 length:852 start_codon:yes stop_codon:yes gene_type:complete
MEYYSGNVQYRLYEPDSGVEYTPSMWKVTPTVVQWLSMGGWDEDFDSVSESSWKYFKGVLKLHNMVALHRSGKIPDTFVHSAISKYNKTNNTNISWEEAESLSDRYVFSPAGDVVAFVKANENPNIDAPCSRKVEIDRTLFYIMQQNTCEPLEGDLRNHIDLFEWILVWHTECDILMVYKSPFVADMMIVSDSRDGEEIGVGTSDVLIDGAHSLGDAWEQTDNYKMSYALPVEMIEGIAEDLTGVEPITQPIDEMAWATMDYNRPIIRTETHITYYPMQGEQQ